MHGYGQGKGHNLYRDAVTLLVETRESKESGNGGLSPAEGIIGSIEDLMSVSPSFYVRVCSWVSGLFRVLGIIADDMN